MVISTVNQVVYNGDGVTTAWPYTFRIIDDTDIKLTIIDADGTETPVSADYYVDTVNNTVYYPGYAPGAEPPEEDQPEKVQNGQKLLIYRQIPITQEKDLGDKWPFNVIELGLDKLTMILQQMFGWWERSFKVGEGSIVKHPGFNLEVPLVAGKGFRVNDDGTGFVVAELPDDAVYHAQQAADAAEAAKDAAEAAAAATVLQAVYYDYLSDMVGADIPSGTTVAVKGSSAVNDGGFSFYTVRDKSSADVEDGDTFVFLDNGKVAEKLVTGPKLVDKLNMECFPLASFIADADGYGHVQGMCVAGDYIIVARLRSVSETVTRYYVLNESTKVLVGTFDIATGHGNCLTYNADDGCVYTVDGKNIYKITFSNETLALSDTYTFSASPTDLGGISYYNGVFYLFGVRTNGKQLVSTTTDFLTYETYMDVPVGVANVSAGQGSVVTGKYIINCYSRLANGYTEVVAIKNKVDGEIAKVYEIPSATYGELEDAEVSGGWLYLIFNRNAGYGNYIYKVPLYDNVAASDVSQAYDSFSYTNSRITLSVDNTNVVAFPDGTNPFNTIASALQLVEQKRLPATISISGTYTSDINVYDISRVELTFANATIGNIIILRSNVTLSGMATIQRIDADGAVVHINGTSLTLDGGSTRSYALRVYRSYVVGVINVIQNYTTAVVHGTAGYAVLIVNTLPNTLRYSSAGGNAYVAINGLTNIEPKQTEIVNNANLNNIQQQGGYYCGLASTAATLTNCPTTKSFNLTISLRHADGWVRQQITDSDGNIYTRTQLTDGTWGGWYKITATALS